MFVIRHCWHVIHTTALPCDIPFSGIYNCASAQVSLFTLGVAAAVTPEAAPILIAGDAASCHLPWRYRHMTPEIRRGDIRTGRHGENVSSVAVIVALSVSVTVNGVFILAYYPDQR